MIVGIVGLPNCGKTSLFNALSGTEAETASYHQAGAEPNVAVVKVPDGRVDALSGIFNPRRTIHATVEYVDLPGLPRGSVAEGARVSQFLARAREVDALVHVVRAFEDESVPHPAESVDPLRDVRDLETEFMLSDLDIIEKRLERIESALRKGVDRDKNEKERALLETFQSALGEERPLRSLTLSGTDEKLVRGYRFLTLQPMIVVLNVGDDAVGSPETAALADAIRASFAGGGARVEVVSARLEGEIAQLSADEAKLFLDDLGLEEAAGDRLIRACYDILGFISFLTVGEDEVRAWTIPLGTTAVRAAGTIHSDLERGFIRAEVVSCEAFMEAGSLARSREAGTLRLEGKDYVVADGDIMHVRFNV